MLTGASAAEPRILSCFCSTSRGLSIIGTRRSPIRSRPDEKSSLFDNAGIGRSTGKVADTVAGMAVHALAFLDALGLTRVDLLGFSLGGMVAQEVAFARPSLVRKMVLVATAPEAGEAFLRTQRDESIGWRGFPHPW